MSTDNVNRFEGFESERGGERRSFNRENSWNNEGHQGGQRPRFVRNADGTTRPQRPRFNREEGGAPRYAKVERTQRSSFNPNFENNRPRFNREGGYNSERGHEGGYNRERSFSGERNYNSFGNERGYNSERTYSRGNSYNSDFNRDYNRADKPYSRRPQQGNTWNSDAENTFRPSYNREGGEGYGQRPRFNREGGYNREGGFGQRPAGGGFKKGGFDNKYSKKKQIQYREEMKDPNEPIRLNKYLANAGVCSRREADDFITAGVVTVNGQVVTELGTKVKLGDEVRFHDQTISIERKIYILLNKPKDYVTTVEDPQDRKTVMDLVKGACKERIYPVGRLDRNTTGVLLLTNDGEMASKLTHPRFLKKKIYHVRLDKNLTAADMNQLATGIQLEDGEIHVDEVSYTHETDKTLVGVEIHSGRNRIVRRMFEHLGYHVLRLDRVQFAGLTKKNLRRGDWRFLTEKEVNMLRMGAFE